MNNRIYKITGVSITILFLISPLTAIALGICEEKTDAKILYPSEITIENHIIGEKFTTNLINNPPNPPTINGPTSGKIGETYLYNVTITDPDEDLMFNLEVDFGDGIVHEDCGCGQSWQNGTVVEVSHKWQKTGSYGITARVQDAYGEWSEWSDPLPVNMPKVKKPADILLMHFLEMLTKLFPRLEYMLDDF